MSAFEQGYDDGYNDCVKLNAPFNEYNKGCIDGYNKLKKIKKILMIVYIYMFE